MSEVSLWHSGTVLFHRIDCQDQAALLAPSTDYPATDADEPLPVARRL